MGRRAGAVACPSHNDADPGANSGPGVVCSRDLGSDRCWCLRNGSDGPRRCSDGFSSGVQSADRRLVCQRLELRRRTPVTAASPRSNVGRPGAGRLAGHHRYRGHHSLAFAAQRWVVATVVLVVGAPLAFQSVKSLHALARRWLVFVPAGPVVHDLLAMADPVLIKRSAITRFGPALVGSAAADLTSGARGLALEVELHTPVTLALRVHPTADAATVELDSFYFTPTLPGEALDEAERRTIAVG